jgi:predicted porin
MFRNTLFFNRNDPKYGLDFGLNQQQNKVLQTNGFESKYKMEYSLNLRLNLNANWSATATINQGNKSYRSEFFSQNNYQFNYQELKPKLTYQFQQKWRIGVNYTYSESANLPEYGGDKSKVNEMGSELRYSFVKIGVISFKYNLYQVQFKGNVSSPLAYDMLQGLSVGNNQLWGINFQQRIGQNLQINISYDGRKSGIAPIIHTGKMEARYLF